MNISIVIPAFNAAKHIKGTIEQLLIDLPSNVDEIIVINDNSTDNTSTVVNELKPDINVLRLMENSANMGQVSSSMKGVFKATNPKVIVLDDDLKHPLEAVKSLIDKAKQVNQFDVIFGSTKATGSSSWYKNFTRVSFVIFKLLILPKFYRAKQFSSVYLVDLDRMKDFHPLYVWELDTTYTFFTSVNRDSYREKGQSSYKLSSYLKHFKPVLVFAVQRIVLYAFLISMFVQLICSPSNPISSLEISFTVFLLILSAWLYYHKSSVLKSARNNV